MMIIMLVRLFFTNVLDCNTIIETKNVEFFEHNYPLNDKISHVIKTLNASLPNLKKIDKIDRNPKSYL